jgi:predicted transcriptional regulator of viral defense system
MKFDQLLEIVGDEPMFETGLLLSGSVDPVDVRRQLSRWTRAGRLDQLRRGLSALAPPFRKVIPHPFAVANRLVRGSYVSGLSVLAHAHLIPEYVAEVTSATAGRPQIRQTALGRFSFRHIKTDMLYGYELMDLGGGQQAFVATPEKALLDLIYLHPGGDASVYIEELRLDLDALDLEALDRLAEIAARPKLLRAARRIRVLAQDEALA